MQVFFFAKKTFLLVYDKNFILTMLQPFGIILVFRDRLTHLQFDIKIFMHIEIVHLQV